MQLVCPQCARTMSNRDDDLVCERCGPYPVLHAVPILIPATTVNRNRTLPSVGFAQDIANSGPAKLPDAAIERLQDAFSISFEFSNSVIASESRQFVSRLRSSGIPVRDPYPTDHAMAEHGATTNELEKIKVSCRIVTFPEIFPPDAISTFNVQIENVGTTVLSSKGENPFRIAYWLVAEDGRRIEGARTQLLIDLPPGRAITQPMRVLVPAAGRYRIEVTPLVENVKWLEMVAERELVVGEPNASPKFGWQTTTDIREYVADHESGTRLLDEWIRSSDDAILEIGGNYRPSSVAAGRRVVNVDVDPFGLMASSILFGEVEDVLHLVGDGTRLPIADQSADVIAMFATFHHFPDPVGFLRHLKMKLSPTGRLFLLCEPVGHVFAEHAPEGYINELENGAYEQSFEPWEYDQLLSAGGFKVVGGRFDVGSAKIVAEPA